MYATMTLAGENELWDTQHFMSGYILECPFLRSAPASSQLPNPSSAGILVPGPDRTQRTTGKRFELSFNLIGK